MTKTPSGTRALIRKYFKALKNEEHLGMSRLETEIAIRIKPGNGVVLDGMIITSHKGEITPGKISHWIFVHNKIGTDAKDSKLPEIETPFSDLEDESEELEPKEKETKELPKKKKKTKRI